MSEQNSAAVEKMCSKIDDEVFSAMKGFTSACKELETITGVELRTYKKYEMTCKPV